MSNKLSRGFYRNSHGVLLQQWPPPYGPDIVDDIMVGLYFAEPDGGCEFEFKIEEHVWDERHGIRVGVFDDAFGAFQRREFAPLFRWLAKARPQSLDKIEAWLEKHGFQNKLREKARLQLKALEAQFAANGGRGIELAEEIDKLREFVEVRSAVKA